MLFLKTVENVFETVKPNLIDEIMDPDRDIHEFYCFTNIILKCFDHPDSQTDLYVI